LTHTQPVTLVATVDLDAARRDLLLLEHLPQVRRIAQQIRASLPPDVLLEDLVHAGILGLMDAIRKYDPNRNVLLKHYAGFRIRGAILDSLRRIDWIPRSLRCKGRRLAHAISECTGKLGRDPTETEIATELGTSLGQLHILKRDLCNTKIERIEPDGTDEGRANMSAQMSSASEEEDPYHQTLRAEMMLLIAKATDELSDRERQVLSLYHFEELSMKEIGAALGVSESRVSQLHTTALLRLRIRLRELMTIAPWL
jgi:RNA polymerase sigma factor for flagellar operon FliA